MLCIVTVVLSSNNKKLELHTQCTLFSKINIVGKMAPFTVYELQDTLYTVLYVTEATIKVVLTKLLISFAGCGHTS